MWPLSKSTSPGTPQPTVTISSSSMHSLTTLTIAETRESTVLKSDVLRVFGLLLRSESNSDNEPIFTEVPPKSIPTAEGFDLLSVFILMV